jgi:hypothetical protein
MQIQTAKQRVGGGPSLKTTWFFYGKTPLAILVGGLHIYYRGIEEAPSCRTTAM